MLGGTAGPTPDRVAVHPHGYLTDGNGAPLDITNLDPSWGWAAGQMISTPSDLNTFFGALIHGRLLPAAQLARWSGPFPPTCGPARGTAPA